MSEYIWLAALAGLFVVTLPLARIDLREKRLPNVYTYSLFIWAVSCAGANAILQRDVWRLLTPLGTGIGIAFLLFLSGWVAGGGVGFGDVKLVAGTSVILAIQTWQLALLGIALAFIVMALRAVVAIMRGTADFESRMPFGPSILVGAWLCVALLAINLYT